MVGAVAVQRSIVAGRGREVEGMGRGIGAKGHQLGRAQQRGDYADVIAPAHPGAADEHRGAGQPDHRRQVMAAVLHRHRADQRADSGGREIERDEFADVGQLDHHHVVLANPGKHQCAGQPPHFRREVGVGQAAGRAEGEVGAVGRVDQRHPGGMGPRIGLEQVGKGLVAPPALFAVGLALALARDDHAPNTVLGPMPMSLPLAQTEWVPEQNRSGRMIRQTGPSEKRLASISTHSERSASTSALNETR